MPLAVLSAKVRDLPLTFALDDSMSVGGAKLSDHASVIIGARISRDGSATAAPGDLEGLSGEVRVGARDVEVRINGEREG